MTINIAIAKPDTWLLAADQRSTHACSFSNSRKMHGLRPNAAMMTTGFATWMDDVGRFRSNNEFLDPLHQASFVKELENLDAIVPELEAVFDEVADVEFFQANDSARDKARWSIFGFDDDGTHAQRILHLPHKKVETKFVRPNRKFYIRGYGANLLKDFLRIIATKHGRAKFRKLIREEIRDERRKTKFLNLMKDHKLFKGFKLLDQYDGDIEKQRRTLIDFVKLLMFYDTQSHRFQREYKKQGTIGGPVTTALVKPDGTEWF